MKNDPLTIEQHAEIADGLWCRFVFFADNASYETHWDGGEEPSLTPEQRTRFSEAKCEFLHLAAVQMAALAVEMLRAKGGPAH